MDILITQKTLIFFIYLQQQECVWERGWKGRQARERKGEREEVTIKEEEREREDYETLKRKKKIRRERRKGRVERNAWDRERRW